jgi:hypothetical protein
MNLELLQKIKMTLQKCIQEIDQYDGADSVSKMEDIKSEITKLSYQGKLAYTIQELSERSSIPVKTLYGYEKKGLLKVTKPEKGKKIVLTEDVLIFLKTIKSK